MKMTLPELPRPLNQHPGQSFTLPSAYYLSDAIFQLEKRQIFYRSWQYVAHETMLPNVGDYMTLTICDENLFVIRAEDRQLRAFYNVCRHRAHILLSGAGNVDGVIVCPYHAWSYQLDGRLHGARMSRARPAFARADFGLRAVRLETLCGCIFVNLDDHADSLQHVAGELAQDLRARIPYLDQLHLAGTDALGETRINAGWKVVVDNFVECYHCATAHPAFASLINLQTYRVETFAYGSRQLGGDIRADNTAYPIDPAEPQREAVFWYLWPNTTFNIMPGSRELAVYAVRPNGLGSCHFGGHTFTVDGRLNQPRADYVADVLTPEDIRLCESVQRGLQSQSYDQGPFIVDPAHPGISEHALHHFHRMVQRALQAA